MVAMGIAFSCTACDSDSDVLVMGPRDSFRAYFENPLSDTERLEGSISTFQEVKGELTVSTKSEHIKLQLRDREKYRLCERGNGTKNFERPGITGIASESDEKNIDKNVGNPFGPSETSNPVVTEYMRKFPGEIGSQRARDEIQIYEMIDKTGSARVICVMAKNNSHAFLKIF